MPKLKTHCKRGHARVTENLYGRNCIICSRITGKKAKDAYRCRNPYNDQASGWKKQGIKLTIEEYKALLQSQNFVCEICGLPNPSGKALAPDHNHETGIVRSLLCDNCNLMIGHAQESIEILMKAMKYLEKHCA